ncbi:MAG: SDR family NAD(P)-dependent oxidoreductase [Verrucomicrobia bacterium]|nr:SDR family NAD(P)-dependent oxidoreductase [Verrucomicrobiota bacterium]
MKILVTGGAGFIGSHLVDALIARGDSVVVIDDFNDFYDPEIKRSNLRKTTAKILAADVCDAEQINSIIQTERPDVIVHLAARAGVRPSVLCPELYLKTNIFGTFNLLEAAKRSGIGKFVFASSSSVYGATPELPFREDQVLVQTLSPYASSKLAGEHLCSNYSHLYGLKVVCLRFFTVYGPRQRPDLSIHKFTRLIANGKPIEVYGDGTVRRDFTFIDDTIQGVVNAIGFEGSPFEIFNLGENQTVELNEVIRLIEKALGKSAVIEHHPSAPGDMPQTYADISKASRLLNYRPTTLIEDGIPRFVDWFHSTTKL